ncbi:endochitinase-like [Pollicipes pollicipes]|uniref:endochitinase-like n=1 Tax=Pollicipes pollicipes TaxID=41117 RepID=UPI00188506C4|nr:endochitinase-like [Pollicipes pollicipes]
MRAACILLLCGVAWAQFIGDGSEGGTTTPAYDCDSKKDGLYPDPDDCHCFFECSNGRSLFFRCPNGTAFSEQIHKCEFEDKVPGCG